MMGHARPSLIVVRLRDRIATILEFQNCNAVCNLHSAIDVCDYRITVAIHIAERAVVHA